MYIGLVGLLGDRRWNVLSSQADEEEQDEEEEEDGVLVHTTSTMLLKCRPLIDWRIGGTGSTNLDSLWRCGFLGTNSVEVGKEQVGNTCAQIPECRVGDFAGRMEKKKVGKKHEDHGSLTRDSQGLAGKGR